MKSLIPDCIYSGASNNFTQVSNEMVDNSDLSWKAKGILLTLLRNKQGWRSHLSGLLKKTSDGRDSTKSGLRELEEQGYLLRITYRDKKTKRFKGKFWSYTDVKGHFWLDTVDQVCEEHNLEIDLTIPKTENPSTGFSSAENPPLIILSNNNTINNSLSDQKWSDGTSEKNKDSFGEDPPKKEKKPSSKERSKKYLPVARYLSKIINQTKNITHTPKQLESWSNEIRRMVEDHSIDLGRIKTVLKWYSHNVGGQYVPVVESGASLRSKFIRLEASMERNGYSSPAEPTEDVQFKDVLPEGKAERFYNDVFEPAIKLTKIDKSRYSELGNKLLKLYKYLEQHRTERAGQYAPSSFQLLQRYMEWITEPDQSWYSEYSPKMFSTESVAFKQYIKFEEQSWGVDILK